MILVFDISVFLVMSLNIVFYTCIFGISILFVLVDLRICLDIMTNLCEFVHRRDITIEKVYWARNEVL